MLFCTEYANPAAVDADARWEAGEGSTYQLVADVPDGYVWALELEVRLGGLRFAWSEGPHAPASGSPLQLTLSVPTEAFLHALASDYVTELRVWVWGTNSSGHQLLLRPPDAYLAWPSGPSGAVLVWDEAAMQQQAPLGITDATLRASVGETDAQRVRPPLPLTRRPALDPELDGEG